MLSARCLTALVMSGLKSKKRSLKKKSRAVVAGLPEAAAQKSRQKTSNSVLLRKINPKWKGRPVIVAATGPSLVLEVAALCRTSRLPTIAVNDAYRLMPWADMLYACDEMWWRHHGGCPDFEGEKWSSHGAVGLKKHNDKARAAELYGLNLVAGRDEIGFSLDPYFIHYGSNSGFQALNIAILTGGNPIILVGFNMQAVRKRRHFFGDHPAGLRNTSDHRNFAKHFERAAKRLPTDIAILNATPDSALTCFPKVELNDALAAART